MYPFSYCLILLAEHYYSNLDLSYCSNPDLSCYSILGFDCFLIDLVLMVLYDDLDGDDDYDDYYLDED